MSTSVRRAAAALVLAGLIVAGCGDDSDDDGAAEPPSTTVVDIEEPVRVEPTAEDEALERQGITGGRETGTVLTLVNQLRAAGTTCGTTVRPPVPPLVAHPKVVGLAQFLADEYATTGGTNWGPYLEENPYEWNNLVGLGRVGTSLKTQTRVFQDLLPANCLVFTDPIYDHFGIGQHFNQLTGDYYWYVLFTDPKLSKASPRVDTSGGVTGN